MNDERWRAEPGAAPSVLHSARLVLFQATGKATRNHNIEEEDTDFALMIGCWYGWWMRFIPVSHHQELIRYFCVRNLCLPVPHGSRNRDACTSSARDTTLHSILEWLKEDVRELSSSVSKFAFSNPVDFDGIGRHGARKSLSRVSGLILYKSRHSCFNLGHPTAIFHRDVHQHVSMRRCPRRIAMFEFICDIAVCRRRRLAPATAGD
ncbi:hypothetical protein IG631_22312 [Alternaria alternata]|nr:hypothetical protein IG631_22312 [Alternaria alternata]